MNLLATLKSLFSPGPLLYPEECSDRVRNGQAILVDVREPAECADGVAELAALLPFSDLTGNRTLWKPFLRDIGSREVLLYCASGGRSKLAAQLLSAENIWATNTGSLKGWRKHNWPIVKPGTPPPPTTK